MTENIFKATVKTQFGDFIIAVESMEDGAKEDIFTMAESEFKMPAGMIRISKVTRSNRNIVKSMHAISSAKCENGHWAWIKRA